MTKKYPKMKILLVSLLCITLLMPVGYANASTTSAKIISIDGDVQVMRAGGDKVFKAFANMPLMEGDHIITGSRAMAKIEIDKERIIIMVENTLIYLSELRGSGDTQQSSISLQSGGVGSSIKSTITSTSRFEIKTPTAVMGVRGTEFFTQYINGEIDVRVITGTVGVTASVTGSTPTPPTPSQRPTLPQPPGAIGETPATPLEFPRPVLPPPPPPPPPPPVPGAPDTLGTVSFTVGAMQQMYFTERSTPEQLLAPPQPLSLAGLDLVFIDRIQEIDQATPNIIPESIRENIREARQQAEERSRQQANNPNVAPDEFTPPTPGAIQRQVMERVPSTFTPPAPPSSPGSSPNQPPTPTVVSPLSVTTDAADVTSVPNGDTVIVTIATSTVGATIYYTLDGTTPLTSGSELYDGPFIVTAQGDAGGTVTVKAIGIKDGMTNSDVAEIEIQFNGVVEVSIANIEDIAVTVEVGETYTLPETVPAIMSDSKTEEVSVTWDPETVDTSFIGEFIFEGTVEGYEGTVTLILTVEQPAEEALEALIAVNNAANATDLNEVLLLKGNDLGLAVGHGTDFAKLLIDDPSQGERQLAVAKDLLVNKPENGYGTAGEVTIAFNQSVAFRTWTKEFFEDATGEDTATGANLFTKAIEALEVMNSAFEFQGPTEVETIGDTLVEMELLRDRVIVIVGADGLNNFLGFALHDFSGISFSQVIEAINLAITELE